MSLTVKNGLNRWCWSLRCANGVTALVNHLRQRDLSACSTGTPYKGRPPFRLACIAPFCNHWEAIDETSGNCLIRSLMKAEALSEEHCQ
jgi:hypothetical protein